MGCLNSSNVGNHIGKLKILWNINSGTLLTIPVAQRYRDFIRSGDVRRKTITVVTNEENLRGYQENVRVLVYTNPNMGKHAILLSHLYDVHIRMHTP